MPFPTAFPYMGLRILAAIVKITTMGEKHLVAVATAVDDVRADWGD